VTLNSDCMSCNHVCMTMDMYVCTSMYVFKDTYMPVCMCECNERMCGLMYVYRYY
jgi:hypothetical protein